MVEYVSSKDLIEMGVLSIVLMIMFIFSLKDFIKFMKCRRRFYEDYISCFQLEEHNLGVKILGLVMYFLAAVIAIFRGIQLLLRIEDVYYLELIIYVTSFTVITCSLVINLISEFIHIRTTTGLSPEYMSINSLLIPKDEIVYEEYENEIIIYRKSKKKIKGRQLASQVYYIDKDQKFIDYVHRYYQKVKDTI
ncbi:hypothetical protein SAMN02746066_01620 [Anaerosporobacter mobilis DSM 15930]|jgi:hypothetical protein|uniref:Uncharacterized protein n=1 Tax=Anaerosporobacter mobilis DSM 15930 TaxID=1120996 RepID=A0A1M7HW95_9FIRM|nr:hypothetical protein [Anaerosporobacter mobilis]SHM32792.1 hypothetical protein SAMN02746066_01620 [Anaerosporobacter mobilis DSM 15930]